MKKPKIETVLFYIAVILALVVIAYCMISAVVKSFKENFSLQEEIKGTVFEDIIDISKIVAELPSDFKSGAYIMETYDAEGTIISVGYDEVRMEIDGNQVTLELLGVDMTAQGVEALSKRADNKFSINYKDANRKKAYVYFRDGTMIQHWLLLNGYASVSSEYFIGQEAFQEIEDMAKLNKVGIWKGEEHED